MDPTNSAADAFINVIHEVGLNSHCYTSTLTVLRNDPMAPDFVDKLFCAIEVHLSDPNSFCLLARAQ